MVVTGGKRGLQWAQEAHINWELNERISLSSAGGSVRSRATSDSSPQPPRPSSLLPRGPEIRHPENPGTPVQRRWNQTKDRLDRTNDALAKRLTVIQELNRKILYSYERMQEGTRRSRWRRKDHEEEARPARPGLVAERRRALGEKIKFERRAGGEWSVAEEPDPETSRRCTLQRAHHRERCESPVVPGLEPSAASSPLSWAREGPRDEDAQERSVLRELNEAIDRFEEEEDDERLRRKQQRDDSSKAASCHDSSWDSGVGGELAGPGAPGAGRGSGWLRVHTGTESSLVYLTLETTAADVCRDMLLSDSLALYCQVRLAFVIARCRLLWLCFASAWEWTLELAAT